MTNDGIAQYFQDILHDTIPIRIKDNHWKFGYCDLYYDGVWSVGYEVSRYSPVTGPESDWFQIAFYDKFQDALCRAIQEVFQEKMRLPIQEIREIELEELDRIQDIQDQ